MAALWILGILLALLALVLLIRVGVHISFGEELRIMAKAGPVTVPILPRPEKKPKEGKKNRRKTEKKPDKKQKKQGLHLTFEDIRSAVPALFTSLKRGLRRTRKSVRIDPMRLAVVFGGEDPARVAEIYGWADAAMWTLMPQIEGLTRMPDPRIHLGVDYNSPAKRAEGEIGLSLRIGDALAITFAFGVPLVKWLLAVRKRQKTRDADRKSGTERPATMETNATHQDKGE